MGLSLASTYVTRLQNLHPRQRPRNLLGSHEGTARAHSIHNLHNNRQAQLSLFPATRLVLHEEMVPEIPTISKILGPGTDACVYWVS